MIQQKEDWDVEDLVPIREKVYQYLKTAILNGEFTTGERLVERELADRLKISRTPIREALLRLESLGFVTTVPRKGVIVSQISYEQVLEVFSILSSLETLAVQNAADKIDEQTKAEFSHLISEIDLIINGSYEGDISQFHDRINGSIYRAAKSPRLYEMLMDLADYIHAFAHTGHEVPGRMLEALNEHREILLSVMQGRAEKAMQLTRNHIENSRNAYVRAIQMIKK
jgi:DNA-binding GntR family transcriptional regulator